MQREFIIADFSGGLNASASSDKVPDRELILCDNSRMDELGSIAAWGASTKQNASAYSDGGALSIHSLYFNPTVKHVAFVGNDVFTGSAIGTLGRVLDEVNASTLKTRFTEKNGNIFFNTGGVARFIDSNGAAHTVDWAPPTGTVASTSPTAAGTIASVSGAYENWSNASNASSSNDSYATASKSFAATDTFVPTDPLRFTNFGFAVSGNILGITVTVERKGSSTSSGHVSDYSVQLVKAGNPTGSDYAESAISWDTVDDSASYGGTYDLWGSTWTAAEINASTFGFQIAAGLHNDLATAFTLTASIDYATITIHTESASFTAAAGSAGNLNSSYTYKATFYDIDGNESEASNATATVSPTNDVVDLSDIGVGDSKSVGRYIYRKGGALSFYYRVGQIADNVTTTFTDNTSDTDVLSTGILLAGEIEGDQPNTRMGATQDAAYPAFYFDRLFWADGNELFWSKPEHPFAYPLAYAARVGDNKDITGIVPFLDDLIIFKPDGIWRLSGKQENVFDLARTPAAVGCDMPFSIVKLQDRIMFCNSNGLWYFDGVTTRRATNRLDKFFDGQTWNGIAPLSTSDACLALTEAAWADGVYYLCYSDNDSTLNNIMVIDLDGGSISRLTKSTVTSITTNPATGDVYIGDSAGFVRKLDNSTDDGGSALAWAIQTKYIDPARMSNKIFGALELDIDTSGQSITPTCYFNQGASSATLTAISTSSRSKVYCPITASSASRKGHTISIKLSGSLSTVNESSAPAVTLYGIKLYYEVLGQRTRVSV